MPLPHYRHKKGQTFKSLQTNEKSTTRVEDNKRLSAGGLFFSDGESVSQLGERKRTSSRRVPNGLGRVKLRLGGTCSLSLSSIASFFFHIRRRQLRDCRCADGDFGGDGGDRVGMVTEGKIRLRGRGQVTQPFGDDESALLISQKCNVRIWG